MSILECKTDFNGIDRLQIESEKIPVEVFDLPKH